MYKMHYYAYIFRISRLYIKKLIDMELKFYNLEVYHKMMCIESDTKNKIGICDL